MHMTDALLSPMVGIALCAVSAAAIGHAVKQTEQDAACEKKIPIMGVMGAFVFSAQMINFTIPATGSSGHIGGGILLAAMLGGCPALLALSAVLIIQCLFFADGGLLALGANIFNMGVIPCLLVYPLLFKPLLKKRITYARITAASIMASIISLQLGAFSVVLETQLSGIIELPFSAFLLLMQPIHLAIGVAEGVITAAVLCFVFRMRPEIMESAGSGAALSGGARIRGTVAVLAVIALLTGGALSLLASSQPDGLEWALERIPGAAQLEAKGAVMNGAAAVQETLAMMPDYDFKGAGPEGNAAGTAIAGIVGGVITFLLAGAAALLIAAIKRKRRNKSAAST